MRAIDAMYERMCRTPGKAMAPHMPVLKALASECPADNICVEFGVRTGLSSVALLAGCAGRVVSFELDQRPEWHEPIRKAADGRWDLRYESSLQGDFSRCFLLLHDSLHNYEQVRAELEMHADKVDRYLVFHDSMSHGDQGQANSCGPRVESVLGIRPAIDELLVRDPSWRIKAHYTHSAGLLVLERRRCHVCAP